MIVFIISFIQLSNNYDFKNITKTVENLEEKNKYCDDFISYIKYKFDEKIPKIKIIINLFFNLLKFIYYFLRLKNIKKGCRIGILFSIILFLGNICEVILTPISYGYYPQFRYFSFEDLEKCLDEEYKYKINDVKISINEAENNFNLIEKLDFVIIAFCSLCLSFFLVPVFVRPDCDCHLDCIDLDFFFKWSTICECCDDCNRNCKEKCNECCTRCKNVVISVMIVAQNII